MRKGQTPEIFSYLHHHPHDVTESAISDIKFWQMKRKVLTLFFGFSFAGLYYYKRQYMGQGIRKLPTFIAFLAGSLPYYYVQSLKSLPQISDVNRQAEQIRNRNFIKKVMVSNGFRSNEIDSVLLQTDEIKKFKKTV